MAGSITDGEDVVQDALFRAYRRLETFDDSRPLVPWLFRIAHNQCIDFLRRRGVREEAEAAAAEPDLIERGDPAPTVGPAIEHLVLNLPPKERACVLLKDVLSTRWRKSRSWSIRPWAVSRRPSIAAGRNWHLWKISPRRRASQRPSTGRSFVFMSNDSITAIGMGCAH